MTAPADHRRGVPRTRPRATRSGPTWTSRSTSSPAPAPARPTSSSSGSSACSQDVPMSEIGVITFTTAAASELQERIREQVEKRALAEGGDGPYTARAARRSTTPRSPRSTRSRSGSSPNTRSRRRCPRASRCSTPSRSRSRSRTGGSGRSTASSPTSRWPASLLVLGALGVKPSRYRQLARILTDHHDRTAGYGIPPVPVPSLELGPLLAAIDAATALRDSCTDPGDRMLRHLDALEELGGRLRDLADDELEALALLGERSKLTCTLGKQASWRDDGKEPRSRPARRRTTRATAAIAAVTQPAISNVLGALVREVATATQWRAAKGRVTFHDLLVIARNLLRDDAAGPRRAGEPLPRPAARRVPGHRPAPDRPRDAHRRDSRPRPRSRRSWNEITPRPGALFIVGDPKQSIYRFRRADIELYGEVVDTLTEDVLELTESFRSRPGIIDWVNQTLGALIQKDDDGLQVAYSPLHAFRPADPEVPGAGRAARRRRAEGLHHARRPPGARSHRARRARAPGPQRRLAGAGRTRRTRRATRSTRRATNGCARPASPTSRCCSRPARCSPSSKPRSKPPTSRCGSRASRCCSRPPRAGTSSRSWARSTTRPTRSGWSRHCAPRRSDARTPTCSSTATRTAAGPSSTARPRRSPPTTRSWSGSPISGVLHDHHLWESPAETVERVMRERGLFTLALANRRPRDHWRRLRFLTDAAHAFTDAGGASLRGFVDWLDEQRDEGARVNESVVPEPDDDAVRVLTVHGSKGLEFPVVLLAGLGVGYRANPARAVPRRSRSRSSGSPPRSAGNWCTARVRGPRRARRPRRPPGRHAPALRRDDPRPGPPRRQPPPRRGHEVPRRGDRTRRRATAAAVAGRDRSMSTPSPGAPASAAVQLSWDAGRAARSDDRRVERDVWWHDAAGSRSRAPRRMPVIAATGIAHALRPDRGSSSNRRSTRCVEPEDDRPAWRRGRGATALGRAVHAVLQTVDLETGAGIEGAARAQALAEGIPDREDHDRRDGAQRARGTDRPSRGAAAGRGVRSRSRPRSTAPRSRGSSTS